jgi:hypothetical protein
VKTKQSLQTLASVALFVAVFLISDVLSFGLIPELLYDKLSELSIQIIASCVSLALTIVVLFVTLVESEVGRGTEVTVALPVEGYSRQARPC